VQTAIAATNQAAALKPAGAQGFPSLPKIARAPDSAPARPAPGVVAPRSAAHPAA
jgi:hypothetical protein